MLYQSMAKSGHQALLALAAAVWLCLVVASACPVTTKLTAVSFQQRCQQLERVCVDHSVFVLYQNRHNPRHAAFEGVPSMQLKNMSMNYNGFDGTQFQHPGPVLRPATPGEETVDLSHPQFSRCTVPIVIYAHNLYSYGDFFVNTAAPLYVMQVNQTIDNRLTIAVDTLGMRLHKFHRFLLRPFFVYQVTTLSQLSSRRPLPSRESSNPDGLHVRCFRRLLVCQMHGAGGSAAAELAATAPMRYPLWSTGQAILNHYKQRLPAIDPTFANKSKLKVLIAALPRSDNIRALVNHEQVWTWCNKFRPPSGVRDWNGTACLLHEFGRNLLSDLLYVSQADVLVGLHGDSLYRAFFMRKHSSVVEIRPKGYAGPQANQHVKDVTAADGHSIFWWGIDVVDPVHSAPGLLETQGRGLPHLWPRERHVFIRLMACQHIFERIALARSNTDAYLRFRARHEHHITDMLQPANDAGVYDNDGGTAVAGGAGAARRADMVANTTAGRAAAGRLPPAPAAGQSQLPAPAARRPAAAPAEGAPATPVLSRASSSPLSPSPAAAGYHNGAQQQPSAATAAAAAAAAATAGDETVTATMRRVRAASV